MSDTILRLPAVRERAPLSRSAIYDRMQRGTWPRPVRIGPRAVGWPASEVDAVVAAHIAGRDDDAIREIVSRLHAARATALDGIEAAR